MARMRSLKPEFWHDQEITRLPRDARLLYMAMWNLADEHSRMQGDPRYIKGQAFPYDDDLTADDIDEMIDRLVELGKAQRYTVRGAVYLLLPKLAKHQRLDTEKVPSRLPGPEESTPEDETRAKTFGKIPDQGADESALSMWHVAGGREHEAGSMLQGSASPEPATATPPPAETTNQRSQRLAKIYTDLVPLSRFPAVMGIVKKACDANKTDTEIADALTRLGSEGRSLTVETLRIEIEGQPPLRSSGRRGTDDKVRDGLELARRLAQEHTTPEHRQIGA